MATGIAAAGQRAASFLASLPDAIANIPVDIHLGTTAANVQPKGVAAAASSGAAKRCAPRSLEVGSARSGTAPAAGREGLDLQHGWATDDAWTGLAGPGSYGLQGGDMSAIRHSEGTYDGGFGDLAKKDSFPVDFNQNVEGSYGGFANASSFGSDDRFRPDDRTSAWEEPQSSCEIVMPVDDDAFSPATCHEGSIVEVYSSSTQRWSVAYVAHEHPENLLTMKFFLGGALKQKTLSRADEQLAAFGTHCGDHLPDGFVLRPSMSRPGHTVYLDTCTGKKYATAALAWMLHFERASCQRDEDVTREPANADVARQED